MENQKKLTLHVSENMSKAEEIEVLEKLLTNLPTDSYLYMMFNGLGPWATQQIENDFGMNVIQTMDELRAEASKAAKEVREAKEDLAKETGRFNELVDRVANLQTQLAEEHRAKTGALTKVCEIQEEMDRMKKHHGQEIAGLEIKIMELKAQVYDLEHPAGA